MSFEKMSLSTADVSRFLDTHMIGEVTDIHPLTGGEWSQAFGFDKGRGKYVIRFSPTADDFEKDIHANQFNSDNLPIPQVLDTGEAFEGNFAVSERATGVILDDLSPVEMLAIVPSLQLAIKAINESDVTDSEGFGVWEGDGKSDYKTWREFLTSVNQDEPDSRTPGWYNSLSERPEWAEQFNQVYDLLEALSERLPEHRALIHNDLINRNVMVADGKISAVFDWGFSMYGDPLYDTARMEFFRPLYQPIRLIQWGRFVTGQALKDEEEADTTEDRLLACLLHIGLEAQTYHAYKKDWDSFRLIAARTLEISGLSDKSSAINKT